MKIINPANEETLAELKEDTRESVMKKFRSLKNGWRSWAEVPVQERIACIQRFDELLEKDKDELAETLTSEMGKPIRESYNELNGARSRLKYFIENSEKYLSDEFTFTMSLNSVPSSTLTLCLRSRSIL